LSWTIVIRLVCTAVMSRRIWRFPSSLPSIHTPQHFIIFFTEHFSK
jgi:hypothetical protein